MKYVRVELATGPQLEGWQYCRDPETESIVLVTFDATFTKLIDTSVANGTHIKAVTELDLPQGAPEHLEALVKLADDVFRPTVKHDGADAEQLAQKRQAVMDWLSGKNRLDCQLKDDVIVLMNVVEILPPYTVDSCQSNNEVVLDRVRHLLSQMPQ